MTVAVIPLLRYLLFLKATIRHLRSTPILPAPGIYGGQIQNVQQDNDINQTIGDNNVVTNNVDNLVSQQNGFGSANLFKSRFMKEYDFFK